MQLKRRPVDEPRSQAGIPDRAIKHLYVLATHGHAVVDKEQTPECGAKLMQGPEVGIGKRYRGLDEAFGLHPL